MILMQNGMKHRRCFFAVLTTLQNLLGSQPALKNPEILNALILHQPANQDHSKARVL